MNCDHRITPDQALGYSAGIGVTAGAGALAAIAFSNPFTAGVGATCAATDVAVTPVFHWLGKKVFNMDEGASSKTARAIVSLVGGFFASVGVTMAVSSAMGAPLSFGASCLFTVATVGVGIGMFIGAAGLAVIAKLAYDRLRR